MTTTGAEADSLDLLTALGLTATKLQERDDQKMPDIFALGDQGLRYLIEVKEKVPDPQEERARRTTLRKGDVYEDSQSVARLNRLSGIVGDAVEQLASPGAPAADLRLICFVAAGRDPKVQLDQLFHTVYGAWELLDLERGETRICLYYTFSDFYRYASTLDGVLGVDAEGVTLWINALSPRAALLAESELAAALSGGVYDPLARERDGCVYVADADLDRRERGPVLLYVQRKYDRWHKLTELSPVAYVAEALVARPTEGGSSPWATT